MSESHFWEVAGTALLVVLIAALLWLHFAGPCEWYAWAALKDVPVRCIEHFAGRVG